MKIKCIDCGHYGYASNSNANKVLMGVAFHCPKCNRSTPHCVEEDEPQTTLPERVARIFSALLQAELGFPTVEEIVGTNNERNDDTCASHDFCDANVFMSMAFTLTGHTDPTPWDDTATDLWNAAWAIAKTNKFYLNALLEPS